MNAAAGSDTTAPPAPEPLSSAPARPRTAPFRLILASCTVVIAAAILGLGWATGEIFAKHLLRLETDHTATFVSHITSSRESDTGTEAFWAEVGRHLMGDFPGVLHARIYDPSGRVMWSNVPALVGQTFHHGDLTRSLRGEVIGELRHVGEGESQFAGTVRDVLEVYVPVPSLAKAGVVAVAETYEDGAPKRAEIAQVRHAAWLVAASVGLLLWLAVAWVVRRASQIQRRAHDVERIELEQRLGLSERLRATGEIAAGIAHDLNNLFTNVLARIDLIKLDKVDPQVSLDAIEHATLDAVTIVRRLQDLARHRRAHPVEAIDPNRLLSDALALTEPRWKRRTAVRARVLAGEVPPIVGRPAELREVLVNLILNAIDAMPQGGNLTLASRAVDGQVMIDVVDTGLGMSSEVRRHIFDPFFTTKPEGTGLGLSVAYGIIRQHHGEIVVDSEPGKGSTFRVVLPKMTPKVC